MDSLEGIYYYDKFYQVGLFKITEKEYLGVVVSSDINLWQKGQIAIRLYEYETDIFKAIYAHPLMKNFISYPNEKYKHHSLINSYFYGSYSQYVYSKKPQQASYSNLPVSSPKFGFKNIATDVQYVRMGSFQANNTTAQQSKQLYDSIQHKLTASNLIIDIRNNDGGAKNQSQKFLKLLQKYKGNLYVLVNNETVSQAEIFVLSLKKLKHVIIAGETTKGMLTYGSNYGKREKLPDGKFEVYLTDMKGSKEHLKYENYGITPDIFLSDTSDWIDQLLERLQHLH
jgi:hypothetical protein